MFLDQRVVGGIGDGQQTADLERRRKAEGAEHISGQAGPAGDLIQMAHGITCDRRAVDARLKAINQKVQHVGLDRRVDDGDRAPVVDDIQHLRDEKAGTRHDR